MEFLLRTWTVGDILCWSGDTEEEVRERQGHRRKVKKARRPDITPWAVSEPQATEERGGG